MATAPIETWDALVAAISAEDAPTFSLPDDWCYQGASPDDLRAYAARELSGVGPKEAATALIRASILIQILGTRKSTDLGEKKAKFKEGVQKAVMANKTSQKEVSGLRGYSLNAVGGGVSRAGLDLLDQLIREADPGIAAACSSPKPSRCLAVQRPGNHRQERGEHEHRSRKGGTGRSREGQAWLRRPPTSGWTRTQEAHHDDGWSFRRGKTGNLRGFTFGEGL